MTKHDLATFLEIYWRSVKTPFGYLKLESSTTQLLAIEFTSMPAVDSAQQPPLLDRVQDQLERYWGDPNWQFDLPLRQSGTPYQQRVWDGLTKIPPGSTKTYGSLASDLLSGPRAIAMACRANEFPIVVPCHRVVAASGLGGYAGYVDGDFIEIKRWLLKHEGAPSA